MAFEGPQIHFVRGEQDALARVQQALSLARELEELLEDAPSVAPPPREGAMTQGATSTRMARAMAAGLVDELEALVRRVRAHVA